MNKQELIERTLQAMNAVPAEMAEEIADFAALVFRHHSEAAQHISKPKEKVTEFSLCDFFDEDEVLYPEADFKEFCNSL